MNLNDLIVFVRYRVPYMVRSALWILLNYYRFKKKLNEKGIIELRLFKYIHWHDGFHYFSGLMGSSKVFIKTDLRIGLLKNELIVNNALKKEIALQKLNLNVPNILFYDFDGEYPFLVMELIAASSLEKYNSHIIPQKTKKQLAIVLLETARLLNKIGVVHRDIRENNFIIDTQNSKFYLIDFYFATSTSDSSLLLHEIPSNFSHLNSTLGEKSRKSDNVWDDAYSLFQVARMFDLEGFDEIDQLSNLIGKNEFKYS
jgi:serine/threonine protein kinase